jgi:hypothetical protein
MAAALFLLAGLALGAGFCALVVLLLAKAWPGAWRGALIYFGLGDDPEAEIVEDQGRELRSRSLREAAEGESFAWPASR